MSCTGSASDRCAQREEVNKLIDTKQYNKVVLAMVHKDSFLTSSWYIKKLNRKMQQQGFLLLRIKGVIQKSFQRHDKGSAYTSKQISEDKPLSTRVNAAKAVPAAFVAMTLTVPALCAVTDLRVSVEVLSNDSITLVLVCVMTASFRVHSTFGTGTPAILTGMVKEAPAFTN